MEAFVFACSLIPKQMDPLSSRADAQMEALYASQGQGLKALARVAAVLAAIVVYAGVLAVVSA